MPADGSCRRNRWDKAGLGAGERHSSSPKLAASQAPLGRLQPAAPQPRLSRWKRFRAEQKEPGYRSLAGLGLASISFPLPSPSGVPAAEKGSGPPPSQPPSLPQCCKRRAGGGVPQAFSADFKGGIPRYANCLAASCTEDSDAAPARPGVRRLSEAPTSGTRRSPRRPPPNQAPPETPQAGVLWTPRALPARAAGLSGPCACARPLSSGADHGGEGSQEGAICPGKPAEKAAGLRSSKSQTAEEDFGYKKVP
ncbi:large ribosomal subunit protein uL30 isoform X1 [Colius striatus]|uniref:large ribosomal subunit protein uL30 isoform X1 n=1 Tax=Colius striatus TaxID=57412 RepID=UPI002B1CFD21|nr:large ribosomal subunit protein uL30 isoform X1 [Colius striatus]